MKNLKTCQTCGSLIKNSNSKYCSVPCKNIGISHKIPITCQICGKTKLTSPSRASKKYCSEACQWKGFSKAKLRKINFKPVAELGYFCGLVIGDGCLQVVGHKKAKRVTFYSTDLDLIRFFSEAVKTILPEARVGGTWCKNSGGFTSTKPLREVWVYSQALYDLLRPWKQADFKWQIPDFLTLPDAIKGFIQAIFDTEGGFSDDHAYATSKHASGLQQVNQLLATYGIKCRIDPNGNAFKLSTRRYEDLVTFVSSVGFRLPRKQQKALSFIEHKEGTRIKECPDCGRKLLSAQALATHKHYRHTGRAKVV